MKLLIEALTADRFEPFGIVLQQPHQSQDAEGPGWKWWGETGLLPGSGAPYAIGFLDLQPAELRFDWAERHMHSKEVLLPAGSDCLVYVAAPGVDLSSRSSRPGDFRVFRVETGQGVLLNEGVWHGAPLALDEPLHVFVLLLQGTGKRDTRLVRFPENPVAIELGE